MKAFKFVLVLSIILAIFGCSKPDQSLAPENLTDINWKNGIWNLKDGSNGFFVKGDAKEFNVAVGARLVFAKSGERKITYVNVQPPYVNIYVDGPLDPEGDGFPHIVNR